MSAEPMVTTDRSRASLRRLLAGASIALVTGAFVVSVLLLPSLGLSTAPRSVLLASGIGAYCLGLPAVFMAAKSPREGSTPLGVVRFCLLGALVGVLCAALLLAAWGDSALVVGGVTLGAVAGAAAGGAAAFVAHLSMATGISGWAVSWCPGWCPSDLRVDGHVISGCAAS